MPAMTGWESCGIELRRRLHLGVWIEEWYEAVVTAVNGTTSSIARSESFSRSALRPEGLSTRRVKVRALEQIIGEVTSLGWQLLPSIDSRLPQFRRHEAHALPAPYASAFGAVSAARPHRYHQPGGSVGPTFSGPEDERMEPDDREPAVETPTMLDPSPRPAPPSLSHIDELMPRVERLLDALARHERGNRDREQALQEQQALATSALSEAQASATELLALAQQRAGDAAEVLERALAAEQQVSEVQASMAQREQALHARELALAQSINEVQAERVQLQYEAQVIGAVIRELERALDRAVPLPSIGLPAPLYALPTGP